MTENDQGSKAIRVSAGTIYATNITVTNNEGGGLYTPNSNGVVRASTFYNTFGQNISHFSFDDSHVLSVGSSILTTGATQPTVNCQAGDLPVSLGHNVANDLSCGFMAIGDLQNVPVGISALADNGGTWPTHALVSGSPAVDRVPLVDCVDASGTSLSGDQRGFIRPSGPACDAGAFELDADIVFSSDFDGEL